MTVASEKREDYTLLVQSLRYEAERLPNKFSVNDELFQLLYEAAEAIETLMKEE